MLLEMNRRYISANASHLARNDDRITKLNHIYNFYKKKEKRRKKRKRKRKEELFSSFLTVYIYIYIYIYLSFYATRRKYNNKLRSPEEK